MTNHAASLSSAALPADGNVEDRYEVRTVGTDRDEPGVGRTAVRYAYWPVGQLADALAYAIDHNGAISGTGPRTSRIVRGLPPATSPLPARNSDPAVESLYERARLADLAAAVGL